MYTGGTVIVAILSAPKHRSLRIVLMQIKLTLPGAWECADTDDKGILSEPLYCVLPDGPVSDGKEDGNPSFFQEISIKLKNLYSGIFYTKRGKSDCRGKAAVRGSD